MEGTIDTKTFARLTRLIYDKAGIKLGPHKEALVSARVGKRMRQLGIAAYRDYYQRLEEDQTGEELVELLNVISTNVTQFFREPRHFDLLGELLRGWEAAGQTRFRIWSAAASTGEEAYSIAMVMKESLRDTRDARVLATDLSTRVLKTARAGEYEPSRVDDVPRRYAAKYLHQRQEKDGVRYAVADALMAMVTFARLNLSHPPFPMKGLFDVVFCRNVMIYFDNEVRRRLLQELYRLTKPGGYLMVGHAESLSGMLSSFRCLEPSVFMKPRGASESAQDSMMGRDTSIPVVPNGRTANRIIVVDIADMAVSDDPSCELVTYSLGSCLGVAIYDPVIRVGGMVHCMLPLSTMDPEKAKEKPCMFVDTGVLRLLKHLFDRGLKRSRAIVKIAGCSRVFEKGGVFRIGERNCAVLRKVLWKNDLLIAAEDIGGDVSRTLRLEIGSGRFLLKRGQETVAL